MIERAHTRRERVVAEAADEHDVRPPSRRTSKLTVGAADDALEREADRVADEVIARMPASCFDGRGPTRIVRSTGPARAEPEVGYEGGEISPQLAGRIGSAAGGTPPRGELRGRMEHAFDADFGAVRIHAASPLPAQIAAEAFTLGSRIHFAPGHYDPASRARQRLLAHELTHVVQQTGRIRRMSPVIQRDPGFEFESDGFRTRRTHNKGGSLPATPFPDAGTTGCGSTDSGSRHCQCVYGWKTASHHGRTASGRATR